MQVKNLTFQNQPFLSYKLEVADHHTFFIGKSRAWVHNGCIDKFVGAYSRAGGHHILSSSAFQNAAGRASGYISQYFRGKAWAIGLDKFKGLGIRIPHTGKGSVTSIQKEEYEAFAWMILGEC